MQLVQERDGRHQLPASTVFAEPEIETLEALVPSLEGNTERQKNPHPTRSLARASWVVARPQFRGGLQHRNDLGLEEIGQRVRAAAAAGLLMIGRQPVIVLEAIGCGCADRCLRRGHRRRVGLSELHL
jgi:hypothetical protein